MLCSVERSLGLKTGAYKEREGDVHAVVVHTTGYGPIRRWKAKPDKYGDPFGAAIHIYTRIMKAGPHYLIGQRKGQIVRICPEEYTAWHVGARGSHVYKRANWYNAGTEWWLDRWREYSSPRDLAGGKLWDGGSCNANTIGIEVVPHERNPFGPWTDECWTSLTRLIGDVCGRHYIPIARSFVVSHSDAHPRSRSAKGKPWDPRPSQWTWSEYCRRTGRHLACGVV